MDISTNLRSTPRTHTQAGRLPDVLGLGGAIAGLGAGLVMAAVAAGIAVMRGDDIWLEAKQIAAPLFAGFNPNGVGFAFGPVFVGTLIHLIVSIILGVAYSLLTRRVLKLPSDMGVPVLAGLIYGFAMWSVAYFIALPLLNPALLDMYQPAFIIQHLIFGVVLGLFYAMLRPSSYLQHALENRHLRRAEHE